MHLFFKVIYQQDGMDCGSACLAMIARHYGCHETLATIRHFCGNSRNGLSLLTINTAAQHLGFKTKAVTLTFNALIEDLQLPCIIHWRQKHFVVVYKISKTHIYTADPALGKIKYTYQQFQELWTSNESGEGFALLFQPTERISQVPPVSKVKRTNNSFFKTYIHPYRKQLFFIIALLIGSTLLQSLFPFLTQAVVDKGINPKNIHILVVILLAQVALTIGRTLFQFVQGRIVLRVGTYMNIAMTQNLLLKLVKLPIRFFDTRQSGDILQRFGDQSRIEEFITSSALYILLSVVSLIVFAIILFIYHKLIFLVFIIGSLLYVVWTILFLSQRRIIDYERFGLISSVQDETIQFVRGMQEIKLNNCADPKINSWKTLRNRLLDVNFRNLKLTQNIQAGGVIITHVADAVILFVAATAVINGEITLGTMLAIQYITGSMRSPIENVVDFMQSLQDFSISLERTNYIHNLSNEKSNTNEYREPSLQNNIRFENITFAYEELPNKPNELNIIKNLSLTIPAGKTTAIVGVSGGGKTTLLKLILGFYTPQKGAIYIDDICLSDIDIDEWRNACGTVMQDGFIFSDTIIRNIALNEESPNISNIKKACQIACISEFVEQLPLGYHTKVGVDGIGLSTGQKQRLLIARAVYKNPSVVIMDEATNSLDATNEHVIYHNLKTFLQKRTTIIVAHRLSTIKESDQIVVIDNGQIVEQGTHYDLVNQNGIYANLINNQLK